MKTPKQALKWIALGLLLLPLSYCGLVIQASPALIFLDRALPYSLDELDAVSIEKVDFDFGFIQENNWTVIGTLKEDIPASWEHSDESEFYGYEIEEFCKDYPNVKADEVAVYRLPDSSHLHALILLHTHSRKVKITMWR